MAKSKVIGIKATNETIDKFNDIDKKNNKECFSDMVDLETEKGKLAFTNEGIKEKFVTMPISEYEFLSSNTGAIKHANFIFKRIVKHAETNGKKPEFESVYSQLEAFWKMNGLFLNMRKDGSVWVLECDHNIGRGFSRFFYHLMKKICHWTGKYDLTDKKILDNSLILFISKIPYQEQKLTQK
jgi:hypothetical protein